jgi:hypothetical protein
VQPEAENLMECLSTFQNAKKDNVIVMFDLKHASKEQKVEGLKFGFNTPDLIDPLMQLNLYNLVKSYKSMDDSFFDSSDVYFNDIEELLDIKLSLGTEIKAFIKQISIYFLSLFKSFNKFVFTPADEHVALPLLYKNIILSSDIGTLAGIFAKSPEFSTKELVYIDEAFTYLETLISRFQVGLDLMNLFLEGLENNSEVQE